MPRPALASAMPALFVACLLATPPAAAHHGWSGYESEPRGLSGTIERIEAIGPHATLWLRAADQRWEVVLAPPARMSNRGLPADTLQPGQAIEVSGFVHRTRADELRAEWIRPAGAGQPTQLR